MKTKKCDRCGKDPDLYVQAGTRKYYKGLVECHYCGKQVYSKLEWDDPADAVDDAVEEWNKKMPKEEGEDEDDD